MFKTVSKISVVLFVVFYGCNDLSNEVLGAFGLMNDRMTEANFRTQNQIDLFLEDKTQFPEEYLAKIEKLDKACKRLDVYLQGLKFELMKGLEISADYEAMNRPDIVNSLFMDGDKVSGKGQDLMDEMSLFRSTIEKEFTEIAPQLVEDNSTTFATGYVQNRNGVKFDWVTYNFSDFPVISVLTQLTEMQGDVKQTELRLLTKIALLKKEE